MSTMPAVVGKGYFSPCSVPCWSELSETQYEPLVDQHRRRKALHEKRRLLTGQRKQQWIVQGDVMALPFRFFPAKTTQQSGLAHLPRTG